MIEPASSQAAQESAPARPDVTNEPEVHASEAAKVEKADAENSDGVYAAIEGTLHVIGGVLAIFG